MDALHRHGRLERDVRVEKLVELSRGHRKIILYAVPGREPFHEKFGFRRMNTAMAIFSDPDKARADGYIQPDLDVDMAIEKEWEQLAEARDAEMDCGAVPNGLRSSASRASRGRNGPSPGQVPG